MTGTIDYVRYLRAKISVDDRSLSQSVLESFEGLVQAPKKKNVLRIADIGAGVGTMLFRLLDRGTVFEGYSAVEYTIIDVKAEVLQEAFRLVEQRLYSKSSAMMGEKACGDLVLNRSPCLNQTDSVHHVGLEEQNGSEELCIKDVLIDGMPSISVRFRHADAFRFLSSSPGKFDVLIGAAFLDLFCLDTIMHAVRESLDRKSAIRAFYFPITFNGTTLLSPIPEDVVKHFHSSMGTGFAGGKKISRACSGRNLSTAISHVGGRVCASGESIWRVEKDPVSGSYMGDEAYFLDCIVRFIQSSLTDEFYSTDSKNKIENIFEMAKQQLHNLSLTYEAHNIDVCGVF